MYECAVQQAIAIDETATRLTAEHAEHAESFNVFFSAVSAIPVVGCFIFPVAQDLSPALAGREAAGQRRLKPSRYFSYFSPRDPDVPCSARASALAIPGLNM